MEEEKIFEKPKKVKRKLTDKQLDALAQGRKKAEEKRRLKTNSKIEIETVQVKKEEKTNKKKLLAEQEIFKKLIEKENQQQKIKKWEGIRVSSLSKCESVEDYKLLEEYLDKFNDEDIKDEESMKKKFKELFN